MSSLPSHEQLQALAREVGFAAVGVSPATPPKNLNFYLEWLAQEHHGEMGYMQRRAAQRSDPRTLLPEAKSILSFTWNYNPEPAAEKPMSSAKIARYACGPDYHPRFRKKLKGFWQLLCQRYGITGKARFFSDSAPILERDYAAQSGVGWIGKNTCLIHPQLGSWLFLGEIISDVAFSPTPAMRQYCGTCTACLDACPTQAFIAPYQLDARRCIAYLSIEKPGALSENEQQMLGPHLFGCDICQEVCPWNRRAPVGNYFATQLRHDLRQPKLTELVTTSPEDFTAKFATTPIARTGYAGWQRNWTAVAKNLKGDSKVD